MSAIRDFFKKKKKEIKFQQAGPGHKLTDSGASTSVQKRTVHAAPVSRNLPSEGSQRAGAAALARFEQKQKTTQPVNWSLSAIQSQARKELENESKKASLPERRHEPELVSLEGAPSLTVSGVYFSCPLIGPFVLPREEIKEKIREFLYEQMNEEFALTSCLLIHTLNKNKEQVDVGVKTITKYLLNIVENPTEEKYRKIRLNNRAFQERVVALEGTMEFFQYVGFMRTNLTVGDGNEEEFLIFNEDQLNNLEMLQMMIDALQNAEPIVPVLDRGVKVLSASEATQKVYLPNSFFNATVTELQKEYESKVEDVELNSQLRTRAMRERDAVKEMRRYKFTLLRLRLPHGIILQGTFYIWEKLDAVKEFLDEHLLVSNLPFTMVAPGGEKLTNYEQSLAELHLIPTAIINVTTGDQQDLQLKFETMSLMQNLN